VRRAEKGLLRPAFFEPVHVSLGALPLALLQEKEAAVVNGS